MTNTLTDTRADIDVDLDIEIPCDKKGCTNSAEWFYQMPCGNRIHACTPCRIGSDIKYALVWKLGAYWYCTPHPDEIVPCPTPWKPL